MPTPAWRARCARPNSHRVSDQHRVLDQGGPGVDQPVEQDGELPAILRKWAIHLTATSRVLKSLTSTVGFRGWVAVCGSGNEMDSPPPKFADRCCTIASPPPVPRRPR